MRAEAPDVPALADQLHRLVEVVARLRRGRRITRRRRRATLRRAPVYGLLTREPGWHGGASFAASEDSGTNGAEQVGSETDGVQEYSGRKGSGVFDEDSDVSGAGQDTGAPSEGPAVMAASDVTEEVTAVRPLGDLCGGVGHFVGGDRKQGSVPAPCRCRRRRPPRGVTRIGRRAAAPPTTPSLIVVLYLSLERALCIAAVGAAKRVGTLLLGLLHGAGSASLLSGLRLGQRTPLLPRHAVPGPRAVALRRHGQDGEAGRHPLDRASAQRWCREPSGLHDRVQRGGRGHE